MTIGAVLARILGPGPFGQAIIASTIYGFVALFVNGGFSQALIQQRDLAPLQVRRTFTTQVGMGIVMTLIVAVLAPFLARQFHTPAATPVIRAMSLIITFQAIGLVSAALLRRQMRFKAVQYAGIASYIVGYVAIGLPLALHGAGVWSLVAAYLAQSLFNTVLLYVAVRHTLLLSFHFPDRSTSFGGAVIGSNLMNWGHSNLDNLASSRLGPFSLGLYGRACNLAYQPVTALATTVQSVLLSAAAKVQHRPELLRSVVLSMLALVFGLIGPAYVTLALIPDTAILGLYGTKWVESVPLMVPLALAMPFWGGMSLLGPVLAGIGKPQLELWPQAVTCGIAAVTFFTASHFGLVWIAWSLVAVSVIRLVALAFFIFRELDIRWSTAIALVSRRLAFSVLFGALVFLLDHGIRWTGLITGARLAIDTVFAASLLGLAIWTMAHVVFGRLAISFLLDYGAHLPKRFVRQLAGRGMVNTGSAALDQIGLI